MEDIIKILEDNGIKYKHLEINPLFVKMKNKQLVVADDNFINDDDKSEEELIWIDDDNFMVSNNSETVLKCYFLGKTCNCITLNYSYDDAVDVYNKIKYLKTVNSEKDIEEVVGQDIINQMQDDMDDDTELTPTNVLENSDKIKIVGYRNKPTVSDSMSGQFFYLRKKNDMKSYYLEFDNVIDVSDLVKGDSEDEVIDLFNIWHSNKDLNTISEKNNLPPTVFAAYANRLKAEKMGYDGIKYNNYIQGF